MGLYRAGNLHEVEKWIAAGETLLVPQEFKETPLQIAVALIEGTKDTGRSSL